MSRLLSQPVIFKTIWIFLTILLAINVSWATDRFYFDIKEKSSNGTYVAEAKSPDNADPKQYVAFQDDFTVTLREAKTGALIWTWKQAKNDPSPVSLQISNDGIVIMLDAWDTLYLFDKKGVKTKICRVLDYLPKKEREKFTDWTTAGIWWSQYSKWNFKSIDKKHYFYIRMYWGRTLVIDLRGKKLEKNVTILKTIESDTVNDIRKFIKKFNGVYTIYKKDVECHSVRIDVAEALFVIKKHQLAEGQPMLKKALAEEKRLGYDSIKEYLDRLSDD